MIQMGNLVNHLFFHNRLPPTLGTPTRVPSQLMQWGKANRRLRAAVKYKRSVKINNKNVLQTSH